jgi:hypothetical protein
MKSTEVYKQINKLLFPTLKSIGFRKSRSGMLGFSKSLENYYLLIWFQCSQDGFDAYAGSKFVVEFQISKSERIGDVSLLRHRISFFMTEAELDLVSRTQNEVVENLKKPPKTHYIFSLNDDLQRWYLKKFERVKEKYDNPSDIWFAYHIEEDIEKWVKVIEPIISRIVADLKKTYC